MQAVTTGHRWEELALGLVGATGAIATLLSGGWLTLAAVLGFMILLDLFTGVLAAYLSREMSLQRFTDGLARKLLYASLVGLGAGVDAVIQVTGGLLPGAEAAPPLVRDLGAQYGFRGVFCVYLTAREVASVLRNLAVANVPGPRWFVAMVNGVLERMDPQERQTLTDRREPAERGRGHPTS